MTTKVRRSALAAWFALVALAAPAFADKPPGPWTGRNVRVLGYSEAQLAEMRAVLDDEGPEWGDGDPYVYFNWKSAHRKAWKPASRDMALF